MEFILEANPNRGEAYVRPLINNALFLFAEKTKMLKTTDTATMDANTTTWAVPSDCVQIDRITYDIFADGKQRSIYRTGPHKYNLYEGKFVYWIEGANVFLGKVYEQELIGVDGTFTVYYTKKFTSLTSGTDITTEPDVPEQFRQGICHRVREFLVPTLELRSIENAIWRDTIRDGIKYAQHNRDASSLKVLIHEV